MIWRFVLALLAVYRLAQLVALDDGPGAVFHRLRSFFGERAAGAEMGSFRWSLAELVNCPYCLGVWFSAMIAFALYPANPVDYVLYVLALAGAQALLQAIGDR